MTAEYRQPRHRWFAATYDFLAGLDKKGHEMRRKLIGQAHGRVLEVGCGTGLNFPHYDWSRVEILDAAEPDPYMLSRAVDRLDKLPAEVQARIRLHDYPAEAMPFEDASFDCVVSMLVLCTVHDPARSLAEMRRLLKPDGLLLLTEHVRGEGVVAGIQSVLQPVWGWCSAGCHLNRDTEATLRAAGFEVDIQERMSFMPFVPAFRAVARPSST